MPRRLALCAAALAAVVAALPAGQARATPAPAGSGPVTVDASFFGGTTPPLTPGQIEVAVVSSLTSTVTGEDARIEVRGLAPADRLRVERDGTDVTPALAPRSSTRSSTRASVTSSPKWPPACRSRSSAT